MRLSWVRNVWIWNSRTTVSKTEFHRIPFNATVLCFHEYSQTLLWLFFSIKKLILPQRETTLLPPVWTHYNLRSQSVIILTPGLRSCCRLPPVSEPQYISTQFKTQFHPRNNSPSNQFALESELFTVGWWIKDTIHIRSSVSFWCELCSEGSMTRRVLMLPARGRLLVRPQLGQCGNGRNISKDSP
jgi:hypothetical protein